MKMDCRSDLQFNVFLLEVMHQYFSDIWYVLQENYYWLDRILRSYQSRAYFGDVSASFEVSTYTCSLVACEIRNWQF